MAKKKGFYGYSKNYHRTNAAGKNQRPGHSPAARMQPADAL
jgi:hypothetical protein